MFHRRQIIISLDTQIGKCIHLTCSFQSSVTCKFQAICSCQTRNTFRSAGFFYVCRLFNLRSFLYQCKQIRRCGLVASVQHDESTEDDGSASSLDIDFCFLQYEN